MGAEVSSVSAPASQTTCLPASTHTPLPPASIAHHPTHQPQSVHNAHRIARHTASTRSAGANKRQRRKRGDARMLVYSLDAAAPVSIGKNFIRVCWDCPGTPLLTPMADSEDGLDIDDTEEDESGESEGEGESEGGQGGLTSVCCKSNFTDPSSLINTTFYSCIDPLMVPPPKLSLPGTA